MNVLDIAKIALTNIAVPVAIGAAIMKHLHLVMTMNDLHLINRGGCLQPPPLNY